MTSEIGRNALCPCGSGAKYKKCCLAKDEAARKPQTGEDALIVLMPSRGQITYETFLALQNNLADVKHCLITIGRRKVVEARNLLAKQAIYVASSGQFPFTPREWFVLFTDDDAWWQPNTVSRILPAFRDAPDIDAIFSSYSVRAPFTHQVGYRDRNDPESVVTPGINCKHGALVPIQRGGFHWVLMRLSLLERIGEDPFNIPEGQEIAEDFAFCDRACAIGAKLVVATGCPIVHVDASDGSAYLPGMPAMMMDENSVRGIGAERHVAADGRIKEPDIRDYGEDVNRLMERAREYDVTKQAELERRQRVSQLISHRSAHL
jgi:hypothetical protein